MTFSDESRWQSFREAMPVTQKWAYFDHAAVAPLPQSTAQAITNWCQQAAHEGDTVWLDWEQLIEKTRQSGAKLIGADTDEIALVSNTTQGINIVAEGISWKPGDNLVVLGNEFPSNLYPWLHQQTKGVEVRVIPVEGVEPDLNRIAEACDANTRILTISWVSYKTGWRIDPAKLAKIAHDAGALFFLDAIQGMGVFPLDVHEADIDFLAADGHKWMLGPEGAGLFYCKRELLDELYPIGVGWNSVADRKNFDKTDLTFRTSAARYEGGSQNMPGLIGLGASLDLLLQYGAGPKTSAIGERVLQVTDWACESLTKAGAKLITSREGDERSGIVSFQVPGKVPQALRAAGQKMGVNFSVRGDFARLSPHAYNNQADIDRLVETLAAVE
ncbi:aminotransferase class V-fold PLP-dependent enzyme [Bremerella cremea]|uniref:Cysteine desulfurase n=1 Tax=Blastopirellula marina TaxID=124 RepID=A0A2S8FQV3_9BACT|nr:MULTISPECIES: aminotransferase class V-fold PLP-dependent enzyme [Pirellulaceae]PQO34565.1 cysteine desulfurase [Blastopirellula marina]RCS47062.1 aminotransferase class V-fold PLP-dependent enzyme [Bremerella cremea]